VPHTYADLKLTVAPRSLWRALSCHGHPRNKDASINSIKDGRFLNALIARAPGGPKSGPIHLRGLPGCAGHVSLMS